MEKREEAATTGVGGREDGAARPSNGGEARKKKKRSPSAEVKRLRETVAELQEEREELRESLLRKAAEFDNYRRRTDREYALRVANANAELISNLLPILDDLERSLGAASTDGVEPAEALVGLRDGVKLILGNLERVLRDQGLEPIVAVGEPFDPEKHDALMQIESDKHPSGTVVDEHVRGYKMNDRVLRHAQVLVSK